jgi:signal transduction histidine kinase
MDQLPGILTPEVLVSRIGDTLVDRGLISQADLIKALAQQVVLEKAGHSRLLGQILVQMKIIEQTALDQVITEQIINLKSALEDSNKNLELRVLERTKELEAAFQEISKLSEIKSNLISNISHELRTPITHIRGYLDLLISGDLGAFSEEQIKVFKIMNGASERLEKLIDELIMFTIGEQDEISLLYQEFDFLNSIAQVIQKNKSKNPNRQIIERFPQAEREIMVMADRKKIEWVVNHLIENAFKFSPPETPILVEIRADVQEINFSISDQGIGISEEKKQEIFEPFHQIDGSSTRRYGGIGLGLALAQKILAAHASKMNVESKIGLGSTFDFSLKRLLK